MNAISTSEVVHAWRVAGNEFSAIRDFLQANVTPVATYNNGGRRAALWPESALSMREQYLATRPRKEFDRVAQAAAARKAKVEKRKSLEDVVRGLERRIALLEALATTTRPNGNGKYGELRA